MLVGYANTDDIEYADEYTDKSDAPYNALKASAKDRSVFENIKAHYDLGTDEVTYRDVTEDIKVDGIQKVDYHWQPTEMECIWRPSIPERTESSIP